MAATSAFSVGVAGGVAAGADGDARFCVCMVESGMVPPCGVRAAYWENLRRNSPPRDGLYTQSSASTRVISATLSPLDENQMTAEKPMGGLGPSASMA